MLNVAADSFYHGPVMPKPLSLSLSLSSHMQKSCFPSFLYKRRVLLNGKKALNFYSRRVTLYQHQYKAGL
jgi:hypothetical protein